MMSKQPHVTTLFVPYTHEPGPLPKFNHAWGTTPMPGPDGPMPYPNQPSARTSNAQTVPPLWENRKFRFQKGTRFVQTFRRGEQMPKDALANLDQQDNLVLCLIDMRPKSRKDPTPRRMPTYYIYQNGLPKDWNNKQVVKALNDRRQQAIDRITMDPPWTDFERDYLVDILSDHPDASIKEITERFNWRFKGQDFTKATAFSWDCLCPGRTIESVRHEYLTYKHKYDVGETPKKKETADKSVVGKAAGPSKMHMFGNRDKAFDNDSDDDESDPEGNTKSTEKKQHKRVTLVRIEEVSDEEDSGPADELSAPPSPISHLLTSMRPRQPSLDEDDEELLELAGYNDPDVRFPFDLLPSSGGHSLHAANEREQPDGKFAAQ